MKILLLTSTLFFLLLPNLKAQEALDTIYFADGRIEAVQLTGFTETAVQYNYYGEGIPITTPKTRLAKVITRSGREVVFANTSKKKTVFTAEDWDKVEITAIESEVEGLIRITNVSGKAKGQTTLSSLEKMQNRAMTKMRMQTAFLGCDLVFMLNQTNTDSKFGSAYSAGQTAGATLSGTAYSVKRILPFNIINGEYILEKVYRLRPNEYELKSQPIAAGYTSSIKIDKNNFFKEEDYYAINFDSKIPNSQNKMSLIKVTESELVFLVIDRSKQSKIKYYNLFFKLK